MSPRTVGDDVQFATANNNAAALAEWKQTLDWMRRAKDKGGLGYTVKAVKTTHAYRGYVLAGGKWPT